MNFGEKKAEYSAKQGKEIPVWISPKYEQSKKVAIEIIEKYENITSADFWILMNETKSVKMAYTGLIISHNGCLKINDALDKESQVKPECFELDKDGYKGSLIYTYMCPEQGIYEVGEVSEKNCKNAYPYAMAFKRCFDRVVLKISKLAYGGIYSESEAEEFKEPIKADDDAESPTVKPIGKSKASALAKDLKEVGVEVADICVWAGVSKLEDMDESHYNTCVDRVNTLKEEVDDK